ncbi:MAG: nickel-dependent lactate racemase [Candidatus Eisenbacteria bacterium]|nr:nickel-dependent lactate racemase [Candidatus Eisenbacteria bacterium]
MSQDFELALGGGKVRVRLPERMKARVFVPDYSPALVDSAGAVRGALTRPVGRPLDELLSGARRVLVIVPDRTRVAGVKSYLPVLTEFLLDCGLSSQSVQILVANGMHELAGPDGLPEFLPRSVLERFPVTEHDCRDKAGHFLAGKSSKGNEIYLNRKVAEADLVILTGSIGLHYFAGFRGGRKSVLPGVASFEAICANHRLTLREAEGFHPMCRSASLDGNPVHEEMMESLGMIPPAFLLNTMTDAAGNILGVFAGEAVEAHLAGCRALLRDVAVRVPAKADCVIVSCGGYPRDSTMVQSHKAIDNMASVLKDGAPMVLLAENRHGMGSEELLGWFEEGGLSGIRRKLASKYTFHGHTALALSEKAARFKVYMVSSLGDDVVRRMGLIPAATAQEAVADVLAKADGDLTTYVFPDGSETLPVVE